MWDTLAEALNSHDITVLPYICLFYQDEMINLACQISVKGKAWLEHS